LKKNKTDELLELQKANEKSTVNTLNAKIWKTVKSCFFWKYKRKVSSNRRGVDTISLKNLSSELYSTKMDLKITGVLTH